MDGQQIRRLREALGLTQQELAVELGVHAASITRWETGKTKPLRLAILRLQELEDRLISSKT